MSKKTKLTKDWHVFSEAEELAQELTKKILKLAEKAIKKRGAFHFITAGGSTPNRCYQLLSEAQADWKNWHIYMGDERVLPFLNEERNSQALLTHWLSNNEIPVQQIHFINTEAGIEKSAETYADIVESIEQFDLALLGMGEDGHTASLFPGHEFADSVALSGDEGLVIMESDSPKPPAERVSLNYAAFHKVKKVIKIITGESKMPIMQEWLAAIDSSTLPIAKVTGENTQVWVSQEAMPELSN